MNSFADKFSIGQRLATVPLLTAVTAAGLLALLSWQSANSNKNSAAINVASRQRMLNQQFTRELMQAAVGQPVDYRATQDKMQKSLALLKSGGSSSVGTIPAATDTQLVELLRQQGTAIDAQVSFANRYLQAASTSAAARAGAEAKLIENTERIHQATNAAVMRLSEVAQASNSTTLTFSILAGLAVTALSVGWSFWCSRSVSNQVSHSSVELRQIAENRLGQMSVRLKQNAENTCSQASMASSAADQMNGIAQSLATAVEQFEASIREISGNASNAASVARQAVEAAGTTNTTISRLGESSAEISNVIKVINSIAEQTNLLALNATIEAARAGEAGKGFAVVANEVKELAKETSKATEDIVRRIETIQNDTEEAVNAIGLVSEVISQINESQNAIAGAVEEQSAMTSEISRNITEVVSSSDEIVQSIYKVSDSAKNTTSAANIDEFASELFEVAAR